MDTRKLAGGVLAALIAASTARAASFPPELRFRTVEGPHASVHFHQGLERPARRALALAEEILPGLQERLGARVGRVHVVLADVEDDPNGFASPLPYPLVHLRLAAPSGDDELGNYDEWLRLLLTHELTHVVHLEQARGWWRMGRRLFGRAPFLFPNAVTPMWMVEGLATLEETDATAFGRGRDPDSRMVLRMEALERGLPREDQPVRGLDRWPGPQAGYLFGQAFLRDVQEREGPRAMASLSRASSGQVLPYLDELTFRQATGKGLHARWEAWRRAFGHELLSEVARIEARGSTASRALTTRGVRQVGPRFSPDGRWIAYTSATLERQAEVRLMRPDGTADRRLAWRNGGSDLAWTPDGSAVVIDEPERHRLFRTMSDLRAVTIADGRRRWLTRGVRARDPAVSPDGRHVLFVRQKGDRGELAMVGLDGRGLREVTRSRPGVQWSGPAFAPDGASAVASRWAPGGWLDLVRVDLLGGGVEELTHDRARDVAPVFTPDGAAVVFRSDRDGVSNLYALRLADRALLRVTNVVGGAFFPDVHPDGRSLAFSSYTARGYDVHVAPLDLSALAPADPFTDDHPAPASAVAQSDAPARAYRPLAPLRPRFWTPYLDTGGAGTAFGAVTGGVDPLFRHAWLLDLSWDTASRKPSGSGYYQYDRFRPTFLLTLDESNDEVSFSSGPAVVRDRELVLRASYPLGRRLLRAHSISLAWRRERETVLEGPRRGALDFGGLEAAWTYSSARQYPYSISLVDGTRLRVAALKEDPAFGSDVALTKILADARAYLRLGGTDALALRAGGGATLGRPTLMQSYAVGGFPDASLLDVVRTNQSLLRGYPRNAFTGRRFLHANAEYRFALAHPQRGWRSVPLFVRHLHGALFADAAHAWSGPLRARDLKTSVGAALGTDVYVGQGLPVTATLGLARDLASRGETQVYFRTGLAF